MRRRGGCPRSFATLLVMGVLAVVVVGVAAVQRSAFSQSMAGREAMARVRSYWAARGGLEAAIARASYATEYPDLRDAYSLLDDVAAVAEGGLFDASYAVAVHEGGALLPGPADAHAKINLNRMTRDQLMLLPFMSEDVADSVLDWIDADDDTRELGAELGYYATLAYPYLPRNAPIRTMAELELVAGVMPEYVRDEDWNLNGLLDPNEDDGDDSWPPDDADGILDAGWSGLLTCVSVDGGLAASGEDRLDLTAAEVSDLVSRLGVSNSQAEAIADYLAANADAALADFIRSGLGQLAATGAAPGSPAPDVEDLDDEQLALLLDETLLGEDEFGTAGKLNVNTCRAEVLEYLPEIDPTLADAIIFERESRTNGFTTLVDLLEVPGMTRARLATLFPLLTVRSNVFVVASRGVDEATGLETEIIAVVDRSVLPAVLREIQVR